MMMVISVGIDGERLTIAPRKIALAICATEMQSSHRISETEYSALSLELQITRQHIS